MSKCYNRYQDTTLTKVLVTVFTFLFAGVQILHNQVKGDKGEDKIEVLCKNTVGKN